MINELIKVLNQIFDVTVEKKIYFQSNIHSYSVHLVVPRSSRVEDNGVGAHLEASHWEWIQRICCILRSFILLLYMSWVDNY